jgi:hypothetical protein
MNIETQIFLNYFLSGEAETLLVDGIIGRKTLLSMEMAINKLKSEFKKKSLAYSDAFNFIGIRTSNKITDLYDDWFVLTFSNTLVAIPASTKAGKPAIMKYWNRWVRGIRGFGTIKENQQIDYLVVEGTNSGWASWTGGLGFLYQDRPIVVYRDPNTDNIIDTSVQVVSENDGFNVHSWKGVNAIYDIKSVLNTYSKKIDFANRVSNMSEGCQVTLANYWQYLFPILLRRARIENNQKRIIYTILSVF